MVGTPDALIAVSDCAIQLVESAAASIVTVCGRDRRPSSGIHWPGLGCNRCAALPDIFLIRISGPRNAPRVGGAVAR
jgi:hypothetical protein